MSRPKRDWPRAIRALRKLLDHPEQTELAFEVIEALDSDRHERALARMLAEPSGRRILAERPSLQAALCDRGALAGLPDGSFGRAYLEHLDRYGLDPTKLVELGNETHSNQTADPDVRWTL